MSFWSSIGKWFKNAAKRFLQRTETVAEAIVKRIGGEAADWLQDVAADAVNVVAADPSILTNEARRTEAAKRIWKAAEAQGMAKLLSGTGIVNFVLEQAFLAAFGLKK